MSKQHDTHADDSSSGLWYVEGTPDATADPHLDSPQITHDDAVIAGGAVDPGDTPTTDETVVLPTGTHLPDSLAPVDLTPEGDDGTDEDAEETTMLPVTEAAAEPVVPHRGDIAERLEALEAQQPTALAADDDLETTQVRRHNLLTAADETTPAPAPDPDPEPTEVVDTDPDEAEVEVAAIPVTAQVPAAATAQAVGVQADPAPTDDATPERTPDKPRYRLDDAILEGATTLPSIPSRVPAHLWSLLLTLLFVPTAWFFAADAAARLLPGSLPHLEPHIRNVAGLLELGVAALAVFLTILVARWSSLGAFVWGTVATAAGITFFVLQGAGSPLVTDLNPVIDAMSRTNGFFTNVAYHLAFSLTTGTIVLAGIVLIALGFVSHGARRKGRRDYLARKAIDGLDA